MRGDDQNLGAVTDGEKRVLRLIALATVAGVVAMCLAGCASGPGFDANRMMDGYYAQQRTYERQSIRGAKRIVIEGDDVSIVVSGELPPLSIRSSDPTTAQKTIEAASKVASIGLAGYFISDGIGKINSGQTVVEQPQPLVVRPEVIAVSQ